MAHILVVDDENDVLESIREILEDAGQTVTISNSGAKALTLLGSEAFDLVVLDIIMPEMDGVEVCRRIRGNPALARIPILFLTAKGRASDVAHGLDVGGDDYLIKPYDVVELPARVRALLRRAPGGPLNPDGDYIEFHQLRLHITRPEAEICGKVVRLTPTEHRALYYLLMRPEQPILAEQLLQDVWEYPPGVGDPQLVRVHMNHLRAKLEAVDCNYLQNIHGRGYMITR
jgi:DNA-binding response OmpR family regulator